MSFSNAIQHKIVGSSQKVINHTWWSQTYTSIPDVVDDFLMENGLSSGAILCWKRLLREVRFLDVWALKLSKSQIAHMMHRSPSTIGRWLDELVERGYLLRVHQSKCGLHATARLHIILPAALIEQLEQAPKRNCAAKETLAFQKPSTSTSIEAVKVSPKTADPSCPKVDGGLSRSGQEENNNINNRNPCCDDAKEEEEKPHQKEILHLENLLPALYPIDIKMQLVAAGNCR